MDLLHKGLDAIQHRLAFVAVDPIDWKFYVQLFSWSICLFESYLIIRQYPLYSKKAPPEALKSHFKGDEFEKSQQYGRDKARFAFVSGLYKQSVESALLHYGLYAWAWRIGGLAVARVGYGPKDEIMQSIVFVFLCFFASSLPDIPLSVYKTFVLEEKHGFNKTTPGLFITDMIKSWALGVVIGGPFLAGFLKIFKWAGDSFVPWIMAFMISFQMIMVIAYPTVIQPLFNKLSPLREGDLRTRIERLASGLRFPLKHLYEIDGSKRSSHSNAYFFGLPWAKHIVIFDTLIRDQTPQEVEAVLAHELGHWYFMHPSKMLLVSQLHIFTILALFPAFLHAPPLLRAFDFPKAVAARPPTIVAFVLFQMILIIAETLVSVGMNALTRRFEYEADAFAVDLPALLASPSFSVPASDLVGMQDVGARLGSALTTLHVKNLSTVWVDWMYSAYHHSHPTLTERLKALELLQAKRAKKD